jgi:hypothetical protein
MASGMMRMFGGSTRTQLLVLGIVLIALGAVGSAAVIVLPNEDPGSPVISPAKDKYMAGVSVWAVIGMLVLVIGGLLLVGTAAMGLPLVEAAKRHTGVFYVATGGLLLVPGMVVARMGAVLLANARSDTAIISTVSDQAFSSPAGSVALAIGLAAVAVSLLVALANARALASVSHRSQAVRAGSMLAVALALVSVVAIVLMPLLPAIGFEYTYGRVSAVGYGSIDPHNLTIGTSQLGWLGKGETRSSYGAPSFWLKVATWFLFLALVMAVATLIGLALYSANERSPVVYQLCLMPIGSAAFSVMALLCVLGFNGAVDMFATRNDIHSAITNISYGTSALSPILIGLSVAILAIAVLYTLSFKGWLQSMTRGEPLADPASEVSLVDPPTGMPPSPLGWPADWSAMTTAQYVVIAVAAIVMLAGTSAGFYVKRREAAEAGVPIHGGATVIDLRTLPEGSQTYYINDTASEGGIARPIVWLASGTWFVTGMELKVSWTDEPPRAMFTNAPDQFTVAVNTTTGDAKSASGTNDPGTRLGEIKLNVKFDQYIITAPLVGIKMPTGVVEAQINASVSCIIAGDQKGPLGLLTVPDSGNSFSASLTVYYKYYESSG